MNVIDTLSTCAIGTELSQRSTLLVTGPDGRSWLNAVLSCDATQVSPQTGAWGLALTKQGKVLSDVLVVQVDSESWLLSVVGPSAAGLLGHLERLLVMEDAEISASADWVWFALHGPTALAEAHRLAQSLPVTVAALDMTGLGGAVVVGRSGDRPRIMESLKDRAGSILLDDSAWTALRLYRAIPEHGTDYDATHTAHDASLDHRAVAWSKGCYLGQEVVCMQDMRGKVRRRLAALRLSDSSQATVGGTVESRAEPSGEGMSSEAVGSITSIGPASWEPCCAMARLKTAFTSVGTELLVGGAQAFVIGVDG